jgi:nucleoid-associated protein YgaU
LFFISMPDVPSPAVGRRAGPPIPPPASASTRHAVRPVVVPIFRPAAPFAAGGEVEDVYVVRPGDSLLDIAERHGTDVASLIALNGFDDPDLLAVGTALKVPPTTAHAPEADGGSP